MLRIENACAFTGHRPARFTFGYDEEDEKCISLKQVMSDQIGKLVECGVTTFYSGMALGVDQWGYEIVLDKKREHPGIRLVAVRPCDTQASKWSVDQRDRYFNLLALCDDEILISYRYTRSCMFERNDYLVEHAGYLLAVYDGSDKGGTSYTVKRAQEKGRQIIIVNPDTLAIMSGLDWAAMKRRGQLRVIPGKDI